MLEGEVVNVVGHAPVRVRIEPPPGLETGRLAFTLNGKNLQVVWRKQGGAHRCLFSPGSSSVPEDPAAAAAALPSSEGSSAENPIIFEDLSTVGDIHRALEELTGFPVRVRTTATRLGGGPDRLIDWLLEQLSSMQALAEAARHGLDESQTLTVKMYAGASGRLVVVGQGGHRWDLAIDLFGSGLICARAAYVHVESNLPATEHSCIQAAMSMLPEGAVFLNQCPSGGQGLHGTGSGYVYMAVGLVLE